MKTLSPRRRVLFLEFNEITWSIVDRMIAERKLPNLERLKREGAWASPNSVDLKPYLDPWITWVTVHTGVDRSVHGATTLEQDLGTIKARRLWDYVDDAGGTVGVFGSIGAHPPRPVKGFMVPGPFAPSSATFPRALEPIQELNRHSVQIHQRNQGPSSPLAMVPLGMKLLRLGLKPMTCAAVAAQLATERIAPHLAWKRVGLQPLINYDFFEQLYLRHRPDFATWHSNHAAHYMHHYWRAMDDSAFTEPCPTDERRRYGGAIEHGYALCDLLLGRFMQLIDDNTVLVLASSMGQQPYRSERYRKGKIIVRFRDIHRVLGILGATGMTSVVPIMLPQWKLTIPNAAERRRIKELFKRAHVVGIELPKAFGVEEVGDELTVSPYALPEQRRDIRYFFPCAPNADERGYMLDDLFAIAVPTPKEGMHHPTGMLVLWGKGICSGVHIEGTTNLDIAPTVLSLLGLPVPSIMKGRVLSEAWEKARVPVHAAQPSSLSSL